MPGTSLVRDKSQGRSRMTASSIRRRGADSGDPELQLLFAGNIILAAVENQSLSAQWWQFVEATRAILTIRIWLTSISQSTAKKWQCMISVLKSSSDRGRPLWRSHTRSSLSHNALRKVACLAPVPSQKPVQHPQKVQRTADLGSKSQSSFATGL